MNNHSPEKSLKKWELISLVAALSILTVPFLYSYFGKPLKKIPEEQVVFSGSTSCKSCHINEFDKWHGSDHQKAMAEATDETVEGNFNNATYTDPYNSVTSTFFKKDGKFMVRTEGGDGKLTDFTITHTFGFYPLQQYLIPFENGKIQCLNIAWDVEGKKWYRLPPYEVKDTNDWLHWSKGGQTWNAMCAECHSTELQKNFDLQTESYSTKWFEINVGCESCHGAGSSHITWANKPPLARKKGHNYGLTVKTSEIESEEQVTLCAPCHSRRFQLGDNDHSQLELLDKLVPSLLDEGMYHPDGQILEEVYVWGSFTQSKMFQKDVRCSDCHDPHSTKIKLDNNALCTQCHREEEYDAESHHFHKQEFEGKPSQGYLCVKCHMPGQLYMGIDYRPDHSIRIPRPDISKSLETPNSCSAKDCHSDKPIDWVIEKYSEWYGKQSKPHYGQTIAKGRARLEEAKTPLIKLVKDGLSTTIVRSTALSLLNNYQGDDVQNIFIQMLNDGQSLLRYTSIHNFPNLPPKTTISLISPKLYDPVKAVRIEAAALLASFPADQIKSTDRDALQAGIDEYKKVMTYNSDFAPQRYNLGNLSSAVGKPDKAISYYRQAIKIDDQFFPAKVNLAMQLNQQGNNKEAENLLRQVVHDNPGLYEISYSLGLLLAETGNYSEAAHFLGKAADSLPNRGRIQYNYGLALLKLNKFPEGIKVLERALFVEPSNQEIFVTLINLYMQAGRVDKARSTAISVLRRVPDHPSAKEFLSMLSGRPASN